MRMEVIRDEYTATNNDCGHARPPECNLLMVSFCREVEAIVTGARQRAYGTPSENHACTAQMWNAYLKRKVAVLDATDVCVLNILQKCSRQANLSKSDNFLDIAGYAANAAACMEDRF